MKGKPTRTRMEAIRANRERASKLCSKGNELFQLMIYVIDGRPSSKYPCDELRRKKRNKKARRSRRINRLRYV